ncbi:hypothetical protein [Salinigranum rubrum]|nr:hypothetical protein [Salinigranum rubrum]
MYLPLQYRAEGAGSLGEFFVVLLFWVGLFVGVLALGRLFGRLV